MHGPTGNPNMDLVGLPTPEPSPWALDTRSPGAGDKFNPYDDHKFGTSFFGQEHAHDFFPYLHPGGFLYELSPESDIIALLDDHASDGRKAIAVISLLPFGKIAKLGKLGGEVVKGADVVAHTIAFEAKLTERGIGTYAAHFAEANEQLLQAMGDPELAAALREVVGKNFEGTIVSESGRILGSSPTGWTWHHVAGMRGVLWLVPLAEHAPGSAWQELLHPGGIGGMAEWGSRY